ncbi:MAG: hypothetical protein WEA28_11900 [Xanthobacteraceae bacterium]|jgi:hypothetical protein
MNAIQTLKSWIGALTELGLMLLALGIVAALLVGGANIPFFGNVSGNIMTFVKDLGSNGLVGLIALGIILWLFSNRTVS